VGESVATTAVRLRTSRRKLTSVSGLLRQAESGTE
jgi:hypothetical protein